MDQSALIYTPLLFTSGRGASAVLARGESIGVGCAADNDLVLSARGVAAHHARVEFTDGEAVIFDDGVGALVTVNGVIVAEGGHALRAGDSVRIGGAEVIVSTAPPQVDDQEGPVLSPYVECTFDPVASVSARSGGDRDSTEYLLASLMQAGNKAGDEQTQDEVLSDLLDHALESVPAERGAVFMTSTAGPAAIRFAHADKTTVASFPVSEHALTAAIDAGQCVLMTEPRMGDAVTIVSVACVPIRSGGAVLGALYLEGEVGAGRLQRCDLELAAVLASQVGFGLGMKRISLTSHDDTLATVGMAAAETAHDLATYFTRVRCAEHLVGEWLKKSHAEEAAPDSWLMLTDALDSTYDVLAELRRATRKTKPELTLNTLEDTVEAVVRTCEPIAERHGVRVLFDVEGEAPSCAYDRVWVERALLNLVRNAVEASVTGAQVTLNARLKDDRCVVFECADRGAGIPLSRREHVMQPLRTFGKKGGTGLGLAIARRVARAHRGRLTFTSSTGRGTVFTLELPLLLELPEGER